MNSKDELINYVKLCYEEYSKNNFEALVDYCFSYGLNKSEYKKDITKITNTIMSNIINTFKMKKIEYSHKEYKNFSKINVVFNKINYPTLRAKVYIPASIETLNNIIIILLKYVLENKCNCNIKLSKRYLNELLVVTFFDYKEVNKFTEFYSKNKETKNEKKDILNSLIPRINGIGVCSDLYPYSFLEEYNNYLCKYFNKVKDINEITSENLLCYLDNAFKEERDKLRKEMIRIIIKCTNSIINNLDILNLFDYNGEMNIGSINPSDYNLQFDQKKVLYFEKKDEQLSICFGSEDYLNLCYSVLYKNVIHKDTSTSYYTFFRNTYINLLENRYSNIYDLFNMDVREDLVYKELTLMASGYFAYKKLDYSYKEINSIIKKVIEKNLNINMNLKEEIENPKTIEISFPFNIDYASKVIILKDGTANTVINYFNTNEVLKYIPINSNVNLKDGSSVSAKSFLENIYKYIPSYNNFKELFTDIIEFIEYNN